MKTLSNELKIGNFIQPVGNYPIWEVTSKDFEYIENNPDEYKRIPLTKEIYNKIENQLIEAGFSYGFNDGKITLYLSDEWELESEFLHQFQNLYSSLTGQELKIINK